MEMLKKVILSACVLSIVISVADSLKPGEKFARQLRMIFSMIFVSGVIVSAVRADFSLEIPAFADLTEQEKLEDMSQAADRAAEYAAEKSVNDMICRILTAEDISYKKITADINMNSDGSIDINEVGYCGDEFEKASEAVKKNLGKTEVRRIE